MRSAATILNPPRDWLRGRLDQFAEVQLGRQRSPKNHSGPNMRPYLRAANVTWQGFKLEDVKHMNFDPDEAARFRLREGDLLLSEGSGSPDEVGKPALWRGEIDHCCFQNTLLRVRPGSQVVSKYLLHLFGYEAIAGNFGSASRGVNIHHLGSHTLAAWPVAIPPLDEQQRIVEAIEEQFSRLDAGVEFLQRAKRNLTRLRASVLRAAVDGQLIGATIGEFDLARVDEIAAVQLGRQRSPKHHRGGNMRPYLRAANVTWHGISLDHVKEMDFPPDDFQRFRLNPGDILLNEASGSPNEVGKPAIWNGEIPGACFQNTLLRVVPSHSVDRRFLYLCFMEAAQNGGFASIARGVNIMHLGKAGLAAWKVPIPSIKTQESIVLEVDRQLSILDAATRVIDSVIQRSGILRSRVLSFAFSGDLTREGVMVR